MSHDFLNPRQFGPWMRPSRTTIESIKRKWGGGHDEGYYDPNISFPMSVEGSHVVARKIGYGSKN